MAVGVILREEVLQNVTWNGFKINRKSKIMVARFGAPGKHSKWTMKDLAKGYQIQLEWERKPSISLGRCCENRCSAHTKNCGVNRTRHIFCVGLKENLVINTEKTSKKRLKKWRGCLKRIPKTRFWCGWHCKYEGLGMLKAWRNVEQNVQKNNWRNVAQNCIWHRG